MAELLKREWEQIWIYKDNPEKIVVSPKAHFVRKVENMESDLIEMIKYGNTFLRNRVLKGSRVLSLQ